MVEDLNGYFSSVFTREDISSLPVPETKFQEAKSDYLGQLIVTSEMVTRKIKAVKDNKSPGVDGIPPRLLMETERSIKDHMVDFFVRYKLLNPSQQGFHKARSCLTNMLCFYEEITKWIDEGSPVDIVYLDFQKAFNKVQHQRLLLKLKAHGIGDGIINWIEKWLTNRRQHVVVDGEV